MTSNENAGTRDRRLRLIVNPEAGGRSVESAGTIRGLLEASGWQVEICETRGEDHCRTLVREAIAADLGSVVVAGGDGTVGEVARELVGKKIPLGIIPLGTFNNIARSINVPDGVGEACRAIAENRRRRIDVGLINDEHYFFEAAGVGLDATLFPLGEEIKGGAIGRWMNVLRLAVKYPKQTLRLRFDASAERCHRGDWRPVRTDTVTRRVLLAAVANGPYYGRGFTVVPGARLADGRLTVGIFQNFSKPELALHFWSISFGRHRPTSKLELFRAKELTIETAASQPVHADGKPVGQTPASFRAVPGALEVFA